MSVCSFWWIKIWKKKEKDIHKIKEEKELSIYEGGREKVGGAVVVRRNHLATEICTFKDYLRKKKEYFTKIKNKTTAV